MLPLPENLIGVEDGEEIVCGLVDEILGNAATIIAEKEIETKVQPFAQQWVMAALLAAVNSQFMQTDEGDDLEGDAAEAWAIDDEPTPSPVDTWATHSIPVRHKPRPPTPPEPRAQIEALEADRLRKEMLRRRSRQFSMRRSEVISINTTEMPTEPQAREEVHSAMSLFLPRDQETAPKRFRSASYCYVGRTETDGVREEAQKLQLGSTKPRVHTAKNKRDPKDKEDIKSSEKATLAKESNQEKKGTPKVSHGEKTKALNPIRRHGHGREDGDLNSKTTLDDVLSQQSERELADIAKIARETNGSFGYDFRGKLIPVKKIDGHVLPKYSFQTKIAISTKSTGTANTAANGTADSSEGLVAAKSMVPRIPKAPKIRKPPVRKVKVG